MRVKMKVSITGTRNGEDWPALGGCLDVSDIEGADLIAGGLAVACDHVTPPAPVEAAPPVERAVASKPRTAKKQL